MGESVDCRFCLIRMRFSGGFRIAAGCRSLPGASLRIRPMAFWSAPPAPGKLPPNSELANSLNTRRWHLMWQARLQARISVSWPSALPMRSIPDACPEIIATRLTECLPHRPWHVICASFQSIPYSTGLVPGVYGRMRCHPGARPRPEIDLSIKIGHPRFSLCRQSWHPTWLQKYTSIYLNTPFS